MEAVRFFDKMVVSVPRLFRDAGAQLSLVLVDKEESGESAVCSKMKSRTAVLRNAFLLRHASSVAVGLTTTPKRGSPANRGSPGKYGIDIRIVLVVVN